ncbi:MAG: hypothetical protein GW886_02500 [Rhodobacterales bacterium]|nr:hypothetical protein [Rhodobacterales bacterium]
MGAMPDTPSPRPTLRQRLEQSDLLAGGLGRLLAGWLRFCQATTRWDRDDAALRAALAGGPVVLVLWHECSLMGPVHWPRDAAPLSSLRDTSPIGRVSGAVQARLGLAPMAMAARASNRAASREVLRRMQAGVSLGLTGDGPLGPVRRLKDAPLDWARASGAPVFVYACAMTRARRLRTWDRMLWPMPFGRGVCLYRRWDATVPRRADAASLDALRADLAATLDIAMQEAQTRLD